MCSQFLKGCAKELNTACTLIMRSVKYMNVRLVSEIEHHGFVKLELFLFNAKIRKIVAKYFDVIESGRSKIISIIIGKWSSKMILSTSGSCLQVASGRRLSVVH